MQYVYPAVFHEDEEGGYWIDFPDIYGAVTEGDTLYEAIFMAEDALAGMLTVYEDEGHEISEPTNLKKIKTDEKSFVVPIKADTDKYRKILTEINVNINSDVETDKKISA